MDHRGIGAGPAEARGTEFADWYNAWRPQMAAEGLQPDDLYCGRKRATPKHDAKTVPGNIERRVGTWLTRLVPAGRTAEIAVTGKARPARGHIAATGPGWLGRDPEGIEAAVLQVETKPNRLVGQG